MANPTLKIKLNGLKLHASKSTKYLGVFIDHDLSGKTHCNQLLPKLRRANGMLSKARHYIPKKELISLYYTIFSSILTYGSQIWALLDNPTLQKIERTQKAAIRIITFSEFKSHSLPMFQELKILMLREYIDLQHLLLIYDFRKGNLPSSFDDIMTEKNMNLVTTRAEQYASTKLATAPNYNQIKYGRKSITQTSVALWNRFAKHIFPDTDMSSISRSKLKYMITNHYLQSYTILDD